MLNHTHMVNPYVSVCAPAVNYFSLTFCCYCTATGRALDVESDLRTKGMLLSTQAISLHAQDKEAAELQVEQQLWPRNCNVPRHTGASKLPASLIGHPSSLAKH